MTEASIERSVEATRFVILATPRTGSTLLVTLLDSHPEILCHEEPFNENGIFTRRRPVRDADALARRDADPVALMETLFAEPGGARAVGFKLLDYQAPALHPAVVADRGIRKIFLARANLLASFSSDLIAKGVQKWHIRTRNPTRPPIEPVTFDVDAFEAFRADRESAERRIREALSAAGTPFLQLEYTALLDPAVHRRALDFIGVDPGQPLREAVLRQSPSRLADRFSDWPAVVAHMRAIGREDWLQDEVVR